MSYNIDNVEIVKGELFIPDSVVEEYETHDELPESHFLETDRDENYECLDELKDNMYRINKIWWQGEFSGRSYELLQEILSKTKGTADLVLIWEHGDSTTGIHVENGVVTERKVKMSLE